MVDFGAFIDEEEECNEIDPLEIFESLPKSGRIDNLHATQAEILKRWHAELRDRSDIVIELNTGGGKTLIGLLIALSTMRETGEGVLYLVENKQLVGQVIAQAEQIGIPAEPYDGRASLDADFYNGRTVLVGAYQALFNGMSVFGIKGDRTPPEKLGGIIIDDAHASLNALKQAFTLRVSSDDNEVLYKSLLAEFRNAFDALDMGPIYEEFVGGMGDSVVEVPYEYWLNAIDRVASLLRKEWSQRKDDGSDLGNALKFNWPLIKNNLKQCQVVVTRTGITIAALYPLLHLIPSFEATKRRVFMSATITDYGDMVRAYDLRQLTKDDVIALNTSSGVGRRMVLEASPEILESDEFSALISEEVSKGHGVVRLAPRFGMEFLGPTMKDVGRNEVDTVVNRLQSETMDKPVSFINRYNGIDLPQNACRVLILHDLPSNYDDVDARMATLLQESNITVQRIAQRIEQGVGRGVRGASDHCVVLLVGSRLIEWIKRESNRKYFSPAFQAQLKLGEKIGQQIDTVQDFCDTMRQDINSEKDWKTYHASVLSRQPSRSIEDSFGLSFQGACLERKAFAQWLHHQNDAACNRVKEKASEFDSDPYYKGWLLNLAAKIAFGNDDKRGALQLLQEAAYCNPTISIAHEPHAREAPEWAKNQANQIMSFIENSGGTPELLQRYDRDMAFLDFSIRYREFEGALKNLGCYLGFESGEADDNGCGPDVYWIAQWDGFGLAIEAKNEKKDDTPFHKEEAGQLRTAQAWLKDERSDLEIEGVSVHPSNKADHNASAESLLVLTPQNLKRLIEDVRHLLQEAAQTPKDEREEVIAASLAERGLGLRDIVKSYPLHFETVERAES